MLLNDNNPGGVKSGDKGRNESNKVNVKSVGR